MPERFSRLTRFNLSVKLCSTLNFGIAIDRIDIMIPIRAITATAIVHASETLLSIAMIRPPVAKIGA